MASGPLSHVADVSKDSTSKRKRVNRSAKLKQCKLEARREQWLSHQVPCLKQSKETSHANPESTVNDPGEVIHPELLTLSSTESKVSDMPSAKLSGMISKSSSHLRMKPSEKDGGMHRNSSKFDSRIDSSGSLDCGELSTSSKSCGDKSPKSKTSKVGKGSRGDRLSKQQHQKVSLPENTHENISVYSCHDQHSYHHYVGDTYDGWEATTAELDLNDKSAFGGGKISTEHSHPKSTVKDTGTVPTPTGRAWMADDICRPACLPSLKKQQSQQNQTPYGSFSHQWFAPDKSTDEEDSSVGPPQCPICTEDLDSTDSSFEPCPCGFSLCLFCYHRIASEDGRCPGCRQAYNRDLSMKSSCTYTWC